MDIANVVAVWGTIAGLVIGVALHFFAAPELRATSEGHLLRFGSGGTLFMLVWSAVYEGRADAQVEMAIGLIVFAALIAGVVLWVARRIRTSVD